MDDDRTSGKLSRHGLWRSTTSLLYSSFCCNEKPTLRTAVVYHTIFSERGLLVLLLFVEYERRKKLCLHLGREMLRYRISYAARHQIENVVESRIAHSFPAMQERAPRTIACSITLDSPKPTRSIENGLSGKAPFSTPIGPRLPAGSQLQHGRRENDALFYCSHRCFGIPLPSWW